MTLRARFPLSRMAVAAADAAVRNRTKPPGRPLHPTAPEDAALRNEWMKNYADAGGAVDVVRTSGPVGHPVKPCERFIELRYLHCDGTAVKGAQFHIRADGFAADGVLDAQGFVHLGGVPPLGGFRYWFDKDPEPYQPAGPRLPSSVGAAAAQTEVDAVLDWLWGTLQGDFNPDPGLGQIAVNALLGLVPVVDQVLDVRDLIAGLKNLLGFYMESDAVQAAHEDSLGLSYEAWLWLGLFLTALGCIPELGSAVKGALKALIKSLQDAAKAAGGLTPKQLTQAWEGLLKVLNHLGVKPGNAHRWLKELPGKLDGLMAQAATRIRGAMDTLGSLLDRAGAFARRYPGQAANDAVRRIQTVKAALVRAYQRLDAMKQRLNAWLKEQLNKVLGGKKPVENSGSIDTAAKQEGANVHQQEKAPPPEPEIPPKARIHTLKAPQTPDPERVKALSYNHEQARPDLAEGLGGARYEGATGARLEKPDIEGVDMVDPERGPLSLKGPLVSKKTGEVLPVNDQMVNGLADSVIKDVKVNSATKGVVVDTLGLSSTQRQVLKDRIFGGLGSQSPKEVIFLE